MVVFYRLGGPTACFRVEYKLAAMTRLVSDILILVGIILGVRFVAQGNVDTHAFLDAVTHMRMPDLGLMLDPSSTAIGFVAGVAAGCLANLQWSKMPDRAMQWISNHSARFSYVALSFGFAVVLLYF